MAVLCYTQVDHNDDDNDDSDNTCISTQRLEANSHSLSTQHRSRTNMP